MRRAIDISSNNTVTNFKAVFDAGYHDIYIKATEGHTYVDPGWERLVKGFRAVGCRVGLYHFARPENNGPEAECDHFFNTGRVLNPFDLPWVLDMESGSNVGAWSLAFLKRLEGLTHTVPEIYLSPGWWEGAAGSFPPELARYGLWQADYFNDRTDQHAIPVARPWTTYNMWQYSDVGRVPGITGAVDIDDEVDLQPQPVQEDNDLTPEEHDRLVRAEQAVRGPNPQGKDPGYVFTRLNEIEALCQQILAKLPK